MARDPSEQPNLAGMKPVDPPVAPAAPPGLPSYPASPNPLLRSPLPSDQQLQPDTLRQFYRRGTSQYRIIPLPTAAKATINSQAKGIAKTVVASAAASPAITSVGLTAPNILTVGNSPLSPPGGTIALGLAPELPNTVFAAPTSSAGNVAIDSVATTTGNFPGSGTGPYSATVTTTAANDFVICAVPQCFGSSFTLPSGFTTISTLGSPAGFIGYKVVPTTGALTVGGVSSVGRPWIEILAAFSGSATATVRQFATVTQAFGTGSFTNPLGSAVLAGSTIIVIPTSAIGGPNGPGPGAFTITDSQSNVYQMLASNFNPSPTPGSGSSTFEQMFASVVPTAAGTLNFTVTNPSHLWGGVQCWILEVTNLAPPVQTPQFRYLIPADIPGMATGVLDLFHGGTAANLSATGGASQFLRQNSSGAAITVVQPNFTDLAGNIAVTQMNSGTGASSSTFFRGDNTWAVPSALGGVSVKIGNYTAVAGDNGKLLAFNTVTAPTFVQGAKVDYTSGTSVAKAFTSNNTAGNMIVVLASNAGTSTAGLAISDTRGNTYVPLFTDTTANGDIQAGWYALNIGAGANTVTVSWTTGAVTSALAIEEWSNVLTVGALDQSGKTTGSGNWSTSSLTTTQAVEVLQAFLVSASGITSTNSPFTQREAMVSGGTTFGQIADNTVFSTGTYQATGNASGNYVAFLATFKSTTGVANYTLTLPAVPPSSTWTVFVENIGSGTLTINPNSLLIDGSTSNIVLDQNQGTVIFTDGTNYFSERGSARGFASVDLTAQAAAITATTLYAVPAAGVGMYRISWVAAVTTAATTSSTLGGTNGFQIVYTDADDSVVKTTPAPGAPSPGVNQAYSQTNQGNTTASQISGVIIVRAKASTNIQYQMDYTSSGATPMAYSLHLKLEAL